MQLDSVCVFCGSSFGNRPEYSDVAVALGRSLAQRRITLVYGGGDVGLMGATADACLDEGGKVIGVIPVDLLKKEVGHQSLTELLVTTSMHERKAKMAELSDGFIVLPGGVGTYEEMCEILTWNQLGIIAKPLVLLDVAGFYGAFFAMLDQALAEGFIKPEHRELAMRAATVDEALEKLATFEPTYVPKWVDLDRS